MYIATIAAMMRKTSLSNEDWKAAAVPWNAVVRLIGRPRSCSVCSMALTASPSETPGAVLNEIVVAGSCPKWVINSGPVRCSRFTIAESGTCPLVVDDDDGRQIIDSPLSEHRGVGSDAKIQRDSP